VRRRISSPQILQLSGVARGRALSGSGSAPSTTCRVGEISRTTSRSYVRTASKQPVSVAPALKRANAPRSGFGWLLSRTGPAATILSRRGGSSAQTMKVTSPT